ncbi:MAG: RNA 2',3'-cyclic phosphodiesterase [Candidatus Binatia bacterium]
MRHLRAFLAVHPTADVLAEIERAREELAAAGADVRWAKADGLHVTIKFLGEVPEPELGGIERALEERLAELAPMESEVRGLGVFPNWKKPRVVWVGFEGDGLEAIAEAAERALAPLGFPPEGREFAPHLTLGRVRSPRGWEALSRTLQAQRERSFGCSRIAEATLYKSDLRPDGSVYTPIRVFPLGAA